MKKVLIFFAIVISSLSITNFTFADAPDLYISAINPGFTIDGQNNVGEFIMISRPVSDTPISLAGFILGYTNSSGNSVPLVEFSAGSWMTGESILLRLASSPDHELANLEYDKTLAMKAGPLELSFEGEVISSVCWTGADGCTAEFKTKTPTTLVYNSDSGVYEHLVDFIPQYFPENYYKITPDPEAEKETEPLQNETDLPPEDEPPPEEPVLATCTNLEFSEIFSYYQKDSTEQFIEIKNVSSNNVPLAGCVISYKNKNYQLDSTGKILAPGELFVRELPDFKLTKNPSSSNLIEIIDELGATVDFVEYPNGQKKGASYAKIVKPNITEWEVTFNVTKGEPNVYQEFKSCEPGKIINEETGNCIKEQIKEEKVCEEGKYLNPETGRCKSYVVTGTTKTCDEGYFLNPVTGRCKKLAVNDGADYAVGTTQNSTSKEFTAKTAIISTALLLAGFIVFEFRKEITKLFRKACRLTLQKLHRESDHRSP